MTVSTLTAIRIRSPERSKPFNIVVTVPNATPEVIERVMAARLTSPAARVTVVEQVYPSVIREAYDVYPEIVDADGNLIDDQTDPRFPIQGEHIHLFKVTWKPGIAIGPCGDTAWIPVAAKDENVAWAVFQNFVGDKVERVGIYVNITERDLANMETVLKGANTTHAEWAANLYDLSAAARASLNFRTFMAINVPADGTGWDVQAQRFMQICDPFKGPRPRKMSFSADEVLKLIQDALPKDCPSAVMSFAIDLSNRLAEARV